MKKKKRRKTLRKIARIPSSDGNFIVPTPQSFFSKRASVSNSLAASLVPKARKPLARRNSSYW